MQATESLKTSVDKSHEAILSNAGGFTAFSFGGYNIRFKACSLKINYLWII